MKEIFLLKLGEIVLKGANKRQFESRLRQNVRRRMKKYGNFDVYLMQSTVYVEPMDEACDVDGAWEACRSIFGVVSLCRCRPCEKNTDKPQFAYSTIIVAHLTGIHKRKSESLDNSLRECYNKTIKSKRRFS